MGSVLAICTALVAAGSLPALGAGTGETVVDASPDAQWFNRIQSAARKLNYTGTFVYQEGGSVQASRITHLADASGEHEKLESLDGARREVLRHNDLVHCFMPETKTLLVERRATSDGFPALLSGGTETIARHYRVRYGQVERVAGVECRVIEVEPRDALRFGYRLWMDRRTGLLLKAQTLNEKREVMEQIAFTDVRIGGSVDRSRLKPQFSSDGWKVENAAMQARCRVAYLNR